MAFVVFVADLFSSPLVNHQGRIVPAHSFLKWTGYLGKPQSPSPVQKKRKRKPEDVGGRHVVIEEEGGTFLNGVTNFVRGLTPAASLVKSQNKSV